MSTNLIDLTVLAGEIEGKATKRPLQDTLVQNASIPSTTTLKLKNMEFIEPTRRDSLDNNPFDKVQKEVNLLDDPFEIVEAAAAATPDFLIPNNVRTGNLLKLTDDEIKMYTPKTLTNLILQQSSVNLSDVLKNSSTYQSTPITFTTVDSSLKTTPTTTTGNSKLFEKDLRSRLLQLSISNSSLKSPRSVTSDDSPMIDPLCDEAYKLAQQLHDSSRKSSDDSCDDLMNIKPNWIDSEDEMENDLEMMKIPILDQIEYKVDMPEFINRINSELTDNKTKLEVASLGKVNKNESAVSNVDTLLNVFKNLLIEHSSDAKKAEVSTLLDNLKKVLKGQATEEKNSKKETEKYKIKESKFQSPPQIIRQNTFDVDLKKDENLPETEGSNHACKDDPANHSKFNDNYIMEEIEKIFGKHQNVSIVHCNLNTSDVNPTYIVVIGNPDSADLLQLSKIGEHFKSRRRNQSLSLPKNQNQFAKTTATLSQQQKSKVCPEAREPRIPIIRRNSISTISVSPYPRNPIRSSGYGLSPPVSKTSSNSSIIGNLGTNSSMALRSGSNLNLVKNKSNPSIQRRSFTSTGIKPMLELPLKKSKFTSAEIACQKKGPLKATVALKKLTPCMSSPIEMVKKLQKKSSNQLDMSLLEPGGLQSSSPLVSTTPVKATKLRYSFLSQTSNDSAVNRRRTIPSKPSCLSPKLDGISKLTGLKKIKLSSNKFKIPIGAKPIQNKENNQPCE